MLIVSSGGGGGPQGGSGQAKACAPVITVVTIKTNKILLMRQPSILDDPIEESVIKQRGSNFSLKVEKSLHQTNKLSCQGPTTAQM